MNLDLLNSPDDGFQRMLNALEPGMEVLIRQHEQFSEKRACFRGHLWEFFYNGALDVTDDFDIVPVGLCVGLIMPNGQ